MVKNVSKNDWKLIIGGGGGWGGGWNKDELSWNKYYSGVPACYIIAKLDTILGIF